MAVSYRAPITAKGQAYLMEWAEASLRKQQSTDLSGVRAEPRRIEREIAIAMTSLSEAISGARRELENDDLSDRLTFVQPVEADIDPVEREPAAHQSIDRQLAASKKLDVARQIPVRHASTDVAALPGPLLGHEIDLRRREGVIWRRQSGSDGSPAAARDFVREV